MRSGFQAEHHFYLLEKPEENGKPFDVKCGMVNNLSFGKEIGKTVVDVKNAKSGLGKIEDISNERNDEIRINHNYSVFTPTWGIEIEKILVFLVLVQKVGEVFEVWKMKGFHHLFEAIVIDDRKVAAKTRF